MLASRWKKLVILICLSVVVLLTTSGPFHLPDGDRAVIVAVWP